MTIWFERGHDLDLELPRSVMEFAISEPKMMQLPLNKKTNILIGHPTSNVAIYFDLGHDLDLGFSRWNFLQNGKAGWHCQSFMTMTATFWRPSWAVRIYQIVTRITSDVGVLSTHLVVENKFQGNSIYRQVSNIRRTLVGNKIVDNSDVVGASPVGAAPTTSSLSI